MGLAGTMWSTWRLIPACWKSTPHVSTSHLSLKAGVRRFPHPFRKGRGPGHFRSTRLQRTGLSWVLNRDPQMEAPPVAIRIVAAVNSLEHFCSSGSAIWTTHRTSLLPPVFVSASHEEVLSAESRFSVGEKWQTG